MLGKGGVGRSTLSTALALAAARRGERALVFGWTVSDPIGPWFGRAPAGATPVELEPGLSVATYSLEASVRSYFVDHLRLPRVHRHVVGSAPVRALMDAAPGIAELLFLGTLWWLTTLAPREAGLVFDRVIVDAPATGHGASILDMPATLRGMRAAGLLATEIERVSAMMADPDWTGAAIVATPEELALEEAFELVPRVRRALSRPPLAAVINRAVAHLTGEAPELASVAARLSPPCREALSTLVAELGGRARAEREAATALGASAARGVHRLEDQLLAHGTTCPRSVVEALSERCAGWL